MEPKVIWGAIFILYIVPYLGWLLSRDQTLEIRQKLFPGRDTEEKYEKSTTFYSYLWTVGLVFLLFTWRNEWHPIPTFILLTLVLAAICFVKWAYRKWAPLSSIGARYLIAGAGIWVLTVSAWYLIFKNHIGLEIHEVIMFAIFPPALAVIAILSFRWARKG